MADGGQLIIGSAGVTRWRHATVHPDVLTQADGSPRLGAGGQIGLNLFEDASFTLRITGVGRHGLTGYTWSGDLDGIDFGTAVLSVQDDALVGTVILPGAVYRIGYTPDGRQVVEQVDMAGLPPEGEPVITAPLAFDDRRTFVAADSASQIDVMVIYTATARFAAGGTTAIQAEINAAVASANQAYANNGLVQRLRLVFAGEVSVAETNNFQNDLENLRVNGTVNALRNTHGADLVSLFVHNGPAAAFCGIGYLMSWNSTSFAPYGYSVVERGCASTGLTFAHEVGHNMGAHHDPYVAPEAGLATYSHGYVDLVARIRTIMSYPNQCIANGFNCTRITFFSSPNVTLNGRAIGSATTSDNARTLNETANSVANFRQAVGAPPPPPAAQTPKVLVDLNGDGNADIVWRNTSGTVAVWLLNGATAIGSGAPATVSTQSTIAGKGDFNGDGKADILWQHPGGSVGIWLLDGVNVIASGSPGGVPAGWTIVGVGDFNGDGRDDILWRHTSGLLVVWLINGWSVIGSGVVGNIAADWTVAGVGDFNGDGKSDILFRSTAGTVFVWLIDGMSVIASGSPGGAPSVWTIMGVGDFNGDGKADVLWRNTTGSLALWLFDGLGVFASGVPGGAGTDWSVAGVGDVNGDGRADLLWRHTSGFLSLWFFNGLSVIGSASPGGAPNDWQIQ